MITEHGKQIKEVVEQFLAEDKWKYQYNEEFQFFHFGLGLNGPFKLIDYVLAIREDSFTVYAKISIGPDIHDPAMMYNMMEFLCRANYNMQQGNYQMDVNDGELIFKVYVDCEGGMIPNSEIIRNSIRCPAFMFQYHAPGIIGIIYHGQTAAEAIEACELERTKLAERLEDNQEDDPEEAAKDEESDIPSFDEYVREREAGGT